MTDDTVVGVRNVDWSGIGGFRVGFFREEEK